MEDTIKIYGARVHNLKNVDLEIPRRKLVVITGLSGSGKSSLAFDTIYAEGQRTKKERQEQKRIRRIQFRMPAAIPKRKHR